MRLDEISAIVKGKLCGENVEVSDFSIDGRTIKNNQCYVALIGELLDGHAFVSQALAKGAKAAIVSQEGEYALPTVLVKDTVEALGLLSSRHRQQFSIPMIAITGSCGKTSVKEMISHILPNPSLASQGNFNNHIGVPISLLSLTPRHRCAVFELGANHIGEIKRTVNWVKPDVALITNVAPAHLDGFGSIEGVAEAKAEIFSGLGTEGIAIINMDDERIKKRAASLSYKKIGFSYANVHADVYGKAVRTGPNGQACFTLCWGEQQAEVSLKVSGKHNIINAISASAVGMALGMEIKTCANGLANFPGVQGRMTERKMSSGARVIDDTYNANLCSVKAAIDVLGEQSGRRVLILGELAEVEKERDAHYDEIAQYAKKRNIDLLVTCGKLSAHAFSAFQNEKKHFQDKEKLVAALKPELNECTTVLVKGSRSAKMEEVVEALLT